MLHFVARVYTQPAAEQPYSEDIAPYGKVYHTSSPETESRLLNDEHALMWQTHPRTKSSDGYPDAVKDKPHSPAIVLPEPPFNHCPWINPRSVCARCSVSTCSTT